MNKKERLDLLSIVVKRCQNQYHLDDSPEISDEAYDSLVQELKVLEEEFNVPEEERVSNNIGAYERD